MDSDSASEFGCSHMKTNANIQPFMFEPLLTAAAEVASTYDFDKDIDINKVEIQIGELLIQK